MLHMLCIKHLINHHLKYLSASLPLGNVVSMLLPSYFSNIDSFIIHNNIILHCIM